jgi:hypothetical protein
MPYPNLLHPVDVVLERVDEANTVWDTDGSEPVQQMARVDPITLKGQAKYGASKEAGLEAGGATENERGYVLFRQKDLNTASVTLKINDRITQIGAISHDSYITRLEPCGHYPAYGNTLVKAYFADRQPAKH